jgi:energy-coupling factor transporter transmembrane protein EcfT
MGKAAMAPPPPPGRLRIARICASGTNIVCHNANESVTLLVVLSSCFTTTNPTDSSLRSIIDDVIICTIIINVIIIVVNRMIIIIIIIIIVVVVVIIIIIITSINISTVAAPAWGQHAWSIRSRPCYQAIPSDDTRLIPPPITDILTGPT